MPNKKIANEWLSFAKKDLETAILLNKEKHYTDVIAINLAKRILGKINLHINAS